MSASTMIIQRYRLLELYSGIGGMRIAMKAAGISFEVVAAIDVNPVVNDIYCHNFGKQRHLQKNILSLTASEVESMKLDVITMSPPCQPFTRVGLKKDVEDQRTRSFLHVLSVISELQRKPRFIILENVKGFEESQSRDILIQTLKKSGYCFQEFMLTPSSFGIPNSRLRYYFLAKYEQDFSPPVVDQVLHVIPGCTWRFKCATCSEVTCHEMRDTCPIEHFLEKQTADYFDDFLVPDNVLLRYWKVFDIVNPDSCHSCCFTKAYTHYAQGAGSILVFKEDAEVSKVFHDVLKMSEENELLALLKILKLRYFTPREIASIMCFPDWFGKHFISCKIHSEHIINFFFHITQTFLKLVFMFSELFSCRKKNCIINEI